MNELIELVIWVLKSYMFYMFIDSCICIKTLEITRNWGILYISKVSKPTHLLLSLKGPSSWELGPLAESSWPVRPFRPTTTTNITAIITLRPGTYFWTVSGGFCVYQLYTLIIPALIQAVGGDLRRLEIKILSFIIIKNTFFWIKRIIIRISNMYIFF